MVQREKKRSLLFINQYYYPDRASTGQLLTELCEGLAIDFKVTALVGTPSYSVKNSENSQNNFFPLPRGEGIDRSSTARLQKTNNLNAVRVIRAFNTKFSRKNMLGRLFNYLSFMICATIKGLYLEKHQIIITMSDPPTVNFIGYLLKKIKGGILVQICQDIYPEIALLLKQADNSIMIKFFSMMNKVSQKACDRLIAISEGMKNKLVEKGITENKITVIENWIDTNLITPMPKRNPFSLEHGLADKFVVMHSGNIGPSQNLSLLVETAEILKGTPNIIFVVIGDGAEKDNLIRMVQERKLENMKFIPYQDKENLKYSLSSGDIHFLSLKRGLKGLMVPSKVYGIMAAAKPVVASLEKNDDICKLLNEAKFGINIENGAPNSIAKEILSFYNNSDLLREVGDRGRKVVIQRNSKDIILNRYKNFLSNIPTS